MNGRATRIDLFTLATIQMRVFHLSWLALFVCFFAWFAVAPLMPTQAVMPWILAAVLSLGLAEALAARELRDGVDMKPVLQ